MFKFPIFFWIAVVASLGLSMQASAQTYTRTETIAYHDNLSAWVLGQVAKRTCVAPVECTPASAPTGIVIGEATFDPTYAVPLTIKEFGKLKQTLVYDTTSALSTGQRGTLRFVTDGNSNTTTYSMWKRGIPQLIQFPATAESPSGATQSAVVNNTGWITSVTDENEFTTSYTYDPMGRLTSIVYPGSDSTNWNTVTMAFQQVNTPDRGLPAGHWMHVRMQGNRHTHTYYDGLWRPVMTLDYDITDPTYNTQTQTIRRYDAGGRLAFQSYPSRHVADFNQSLPGVWTNYDVLDRPTSVSQDSELGSLTTTSEYLSGFMTRVTNPRGYKTLTRYAAYDEPTYDLPVTINQADSTAENASTDIVRDALGKPTAIRRRNADGSLGVWRHYVYDNYQQLCKIVEPETGATIMDYDGVGNLQWSAAGTNLTSTASCDTIAGRDSGRKVTRLYDARNRVQTIYFPDGLGDQALAYTADGLPATITTYNSYGGSPVVNTYSYNKRRLLIGESLAQPTFYSWGIGYGYDANGSLSGQSFHDGSTVLFAPNALGQPTAVTDIAGNTYAAGVQYYPNGAIKQFSYGNGIQHAMQQNTRQLPSRVSDSGTFDFTFAYDENANTTTIRDVNAPPNAYTGNRDLLYDGLDRLTSAHFHWQQLDTFAYNALDNITGKSHFSGTTTANYEYVYDPRNQLTNVKDANTAATIVGLGYDLQGNVNNKNGQGYEFDYGNRLRHVPTKEAYRYDGLGRRVQAWNPSLISTLSQYSQSGQLLYQQDDRLGKIFYNIYLSGSLLAVREKTISSGVVVTRYQHTDALGSPIAVTDQSATVIDRTYWEPYGAAMNEPTYNGIGYTGHVQDGATGLTYMQQRYYDPLLGKFLSVDPVQADSNSGANFNRYYYAANNPYRFIDPDGRQQAERGVSNLCSSGGGAGCDSHYSADGSSVPQAPESHEELNRSALNSSAYNFGKKASGFVGNAWEEVADRILPAIPVEGQLYAGGIGLLAKFELVAKFNPARLHIFRSATGHVNPATAASRARFASLFEQVASNPSNLRPDAVRVGLVTERAASMGVQGFTQTMSSGRQIWVQVRNGEIMNAGVNAAGAAR